MYKEINNKYEVALEESLKTTEGQLINSLLEASSDFLINGRLAQFQISKATIDFLQMHLSDVQSGYSLRLAILYRHGFEFMRTLSRHSFSQIIQLFRATHSGLARAQAESAVGANLDMQREHMLQKSLSPLSLSPSLSFPSHSLSNCPSSLLKTCPLLNTWNCF